MADPSLDDPEVTNVHVELWASHGNSLKKGGGHLNHLAKPATQQHSSMVNSLQACDFNRISYGQSLAAQ